MQVLMFCVACPSQIEPCMSPAHKQFSLVSLLIFSTHFAIICEQIELELIQGVILGKII